MSSQELRREKAQRGHRVNPPDTGWLDANVILRFLLNDHDEHSPRAKALFEAAERGNVMLKVPPHIVCEVVYILESQDYRREDVYEAIRDLAQIRGVQLEDQEAVLQALIDYRDKKADFADALLAAIAKARSHKVFTFNKHHFGCLDVSWNEPPPVTPPQQKMSL
ncbi:MAG: PIN domain-containing protein [Firmicutes bacterium]|nr:PIN domain-containing protein [Bacillota bacterium]